MRNSASLQFCARVLRRPAHVEEVLCSRWKRDGPGTKPSRATLSRGELSWYRLKRKHNITSLNFLGWVTEWVINPKLLTALKAAITRTNAVNPL